MANTIIEKKASLAKVKNQPKPEMTQTHLDMLAKKTAAEIEAMAERKRRGILTAEDSIQEFTEWL